MSVPAAIWRVVLSCFRLLVYWREVIDRLGEREGIRSLDECGWRWSKGRSTRCGRSC